MKLGYVACALGRHSIDPQGVKPIHGGQVGRCRRCSAPMEEVAPHVWAAQQARDAGLGPRGLR